MKDLNEEIETFLSEFKISRKRIIGMRSEMKNFERYIDDWELDFLKLTIPQAQGYQTYLSTKTDEEGKPHYSRGSVIRLVNRVSVFYEYLRRQKDIHANPFKEISRIKRKKSLPRNVLTEENMEKLLRSFREFYKKGDLKTRRQYYRIHVITELMYATGARINEVSKLESSDIDFDRGTVRVKDDKTNRERDCILNEYAARVLRIYMERMREVIDRKEKHRELLFNTKGYLHNSVNKAIGKESAGLKLGHFTSHCFRHSLGFHLLRAGCDIRYVKEILGHREISTTEIYTKVDKVDLKRVVDRYHPRRKALRGLDENA